MDSRSWRALAVLVPALACAPAAQTASAQVTERLPDLVAESLHGCQVVQTYAHPDGTTHLLLRFDGFVHNQGLGGLQGDARVHSRWERT